MEATYADPEDSIGNLRSEADELKKKIEELEVELETEQLKGSMDGELAKNEVDGLKKQLQECQEYGKILQAELEQLRIQRGGSGLSEGSINLNSGNKNGDGGEHPMSTDSPTSDDPAKEALIKKTNELQAQISSLEKDLKVSYDRVNKWVAKYNSVGHQSLQIASERDFERNHRLTNLQPRITQLEAEVGKLKAQVPRGSTDESLAKLKAWEEALAKKENETRLAKHEVETFLAKLRQTAVNQSRAADADRRAADFHKVAKDLHEELQEVKRQSRSPTPQPQVRGQKQPVGLRTDGAISGRITRLTEQVSQLKAKNDRLEKKLQRYVQQSGKDEGGDEDMDDEEQSGGKRTIEGPQGRAKIAMKSRKSAVTITTRLKDLQELIKKWKKKEEDKRDLTKHIALREQPIVDEGDLIRVKNIITSVVEPLKFIMGDAGREDPDRIGWTRAAQWFTMNLPTLTSHRLAKEIVNDMARIEVLLEYDPDDVKEVVKDIMKMGT
jgi:hypothetical protein